MCCFFISTSYSSVLTFIPCVDHGVHFVIFSYCIYQIHFGEVLLLCRRILWDCNRATAPDSPQSQPTGFESHMCRIALSWWSDPCQRKIAPAMHFEIRDSPQDNCWHSYPTPGMWWKALLSIRPVCSMGCSLQSGWSYQFQKREFLKMSVQIACTQGGLCTVVDP